jgi:predicted dienelactone hydrolase
MDYSAGFKIEYFNTAYHYGCDLAVWFPSQKLESVYNYLPYLKGKVAYNAEIATGEFPLVLISSGYAGSMYDQSYLAEALARQGFIVASVSHAQFDKSQILGCERAWYRSKELLTALHYLQASELSNSLDSLEVNLLGFSAGGFTILPIAGAQPDFQANSEFQPFLRLLDQLNFSGLFYEKVRSLSLFAPALGSVFNKTNLTAITQPTLLITSEQDEVLANSTKVYQEFLPNIKVNQVLSGAGHFVYNVEASSLMKKLFPNTCKDTGVDRRFFHPGIIKTTTNFLKELPNE